MRPCSRMWAAVGQAIDAGMTTPSPLISAAVVTPRSAPEVSTNAPPANPSCIGAVVRSTCSIARRRPVGKRTGNHRNDPGARRHRVAPRSGNGDRHVAYAGRVLADGNRRRAQPGDLKHGETGCRIPSGELGIEHLPCVIANVQAVLASKRARHGQNDFARVHETACRTPPALHLHHGRSGPFDRVGQRRRHCCCVFAARHAAIVTRMDRDPDHPIG